MSNILVITGSSLLLTGSTQKDLIKGIYFKTNDRNKRKYSDLRRNGNDEIRTDRGAIKCKENG